MNIISIRSIKFRAEFHLYFAKYFTIHRKPSFALNFIFSSYEIRILLLIQGFVFRYLNCILIAQIHCSSRYRTISLAVRNRKRLINIHICARSVTLFQDMLYRKSSRFSIFNLVNLSYNAFMVVRNLL